MFVRHWRLNHKTPSGMTVLGAVAAAEIGEDAAMEEDAGATEDGVVEDGAGADDEGAGAEVEVRR